MDIKKHCTVVFGSYMEAHDDMTIENNMNTSTYEGMDDNEPLYITKQNSNLSLLFFVSITQMFFWIIFIIDCIFILTGSLG